MKRVLWGLLLVSAVGLLLLWGSGRVAGPARPDGKRAQDAPGLLTLTNPDEELDPVRPSRPPIPGIDTPQPAPEPEPVPSRRSILERVYAQAKAEEAAHPGERAFRATVSAFIRHNERFAQHQAAQEGLTMEEVEELTAFGLIAQESQRWGEVEQLLEREVPPDARAAAEELLHGLNREFKDQMRSMVQAGASEEARWDYIRETEATYRSAYFETTGMDQTLLDQLLAGDVAREYAAAVTPPPEEAPQNREDPFAEAERPPAAPEGEEPNGEGPSEGPPKNRPGPPRDPLDPPPTEGPLPPPR
ncbi:MAG: hypothetical protein AAGD10_03315 [Myxococcota bacterium]